MLKAAAGCLLLLLLLLLATAAVGFLLIRPSLESQELGLFSTLKELVLLTILNELVLFSILNEFAISAAAFACLILLRGLGLPRPNNMPALSPPYMILLLIILPSAQAYQQVDVDGQ